MVVLYVLRVNEKTSLRELKEVIAFGGMGENPRGVILKCPLTILHFFGA